MRDIKDWPGFLLKLIRARIKGLPSPGQGLWTLLPQPIQTRIEQSAIGTVSNEDKSKIIYELNKIMDRRNFYQEEDFPDFNLPDEIHDLT